MAKEPAMRPSDTPVSEVLDRVTGPRRGEADELVELHARISGERPVVWANRIIGFGSAGYRYESGHGGIAPLLAFATSKTRHTIYLTEGFEQRWPELLERLGPHSSGKSCLYVGRLAKVDTGVLAELLSLSLALSAGD
ncbi:DUF1801 domain-containing protein [Corynebacterium pacaense]|uniref:DUF1801 domain-containing protein n=1 Tax=Corynebacterium pacaense TaxID=1816684 RepID=UPI001FEB2864|nr:DUF1801 domain-containing protein [Corynebacterium pacaense]